MALDVYFPDDVANHIVSTAAGMLSACAAHGLTNREYVRGILDFARAEALGYRIPWSWVENELRAALTGGSAANLPCVHNVKGGAS